MKSGWLWQNAKPLAYICIKPLFLFIFFLILKTSVCFHTESIFEVKVPLGLLKPWQKLESQAPTAFILHYPSNLKSGLEAPKACRKIQKNWKQEGYDKIEFLYFCRQLLNFGEFVLKFHGCYVSGLELVQASILQ